MIFYRFAIYRLRTSYLANIHDGVGERLINVDTSFLNDPAYKAAGWSTNPPELKRCYSPPIPTRITADYFKAPAYLNGRRDLETELPDDDEEGGMVTGVTSNDVSGPNTTARRRRRREQLEEDDSSGLSDESDESEDDADDERPANQIRFAKMPTRERSGSSPLRKTNSRDEGPDLMVTSPSRPPDYPQQRRGSLGAVEALKQRERRDTTTSSEVSSENELDPALFRRRQVRGTGGDTGSGALSEQIREDDEEQSRPVLESERRSYEENESISGGSSLASGFSDAGDNKFSLSGSVEDMDSPDLPRRSAPASTTRPSTAVKQVLMPDKLPELPPARPISTVQPKSALAAAIKASNQQPANPFERFATLSGQGEPNPLYVKMYLPPECQAEKPLELLLRRATTAGGQVTVAEALGYSLWRYGDEKIKPIIPPAKMNVNWWTMRIVEDEEVDFDFPPLSRQRPLSDFTSTNNRPPRRPTANKPWDEFALVEATEAQFAENEKVTPIYSTEAADIKQAAVGVTGDLTRPQPARQPSASDPVTSRAIKARRNPVTEPMYVSAALRKDSAMPAADAPLTATTTSHAVPRSGATKTLNVHFSDNNLLPHVVPIPVTTDTYIAEVFDTVCKRLNIDKALYVLKVTNTTTVAPADRTVEALGSARQSLDLVRRRFIGDGTFGLSGSPGSTSPNAPLLLTSAGAPRRTRRRENTGGHPLALASVDPARADPEAGILPLTAALNPTYRRYNVIRKQPMSFAPSHARILALEGEYMHIIPSDSGRDRIWDAGAGKTSSVHFSGIVGAKVNRKHPRSFKVVVFREGGEGEKNYYFEAATSEEAGTIVEEMRKGMEPWRDAVAQ